MKIKITADDITYAEKVLLKDGESFDKERVDFISCLETLDLQAVPGSGKTTALLAKLLILERHLPLKNNAGILVLSHTNAAVDEIKEKIGRHCPRLFSYPHFIGTIQQFTDQFLAIPYYAVCQRHRDLRIGVDFYTQDLEKQMESFQCPQGCSHDAFRKLKHIWRANDGVIRKARLWAEDDNVCIKGGLNGDKLIVNKPGRSRANYQDYTEDEKAKVLECLKQIKYTVLQNGMLHFDDAYFLANRFIDKYPTIIELMRQRFKIVFVDEMQDMAPHQYDLLEKLFYPSDAPSPVFQRIGDQNQAIYYHKIFTDKVWTERSRKLELKGSHRMSKPIAEVVKNFAENYQNIDARGMANHLPVIVIYDDNSIDRVVPWFANRIKQLKLDRISDASFHVVGWVKEHDTRIAIKNYWDPFVPQKDVHKKERYDGLADYIEAAKWNCSQKDFQPLQRFFVDAILNVLRLEDIRQPDNQRPFTRSTLFAHLRDSHPAVYEDSRLKLYQWSRSVISGEDVISSIKDFLAVLLGVLEKTQNHSVDFINAGVSLTLQPEEKQTINTDQINGVEIVFGTVHSVKGRTHTATLYLETFCYQYDSYRLKEQFEGSKFNHTSANEIKNTRVAYVGMSRPTHLLCVAVHKDRLPKVDSKKWEVVDVATGDALE